MRTLQSVRRWSFVAAVTFAALLAGCSSDDDASQPVEPPEAPQQLMPPPADEPAESTEGVPIAELVDTDWSESVAAEHAIPRRAMADYAGAALRTAATHPECNLGWNTLAGIGPVETSHASIDGAGLDAIGVAKPAIIGPVLDGSEGVMTVDDTDEGELDDDDEWDRAVGPMQFLPETWERYAVDGNLDGETDPQHIDDAVLTAAVYLCESADDLREDDAWVTAVTTYNQSMQYARDAAAIATAYASEEDEA